MGPRRNRGHPLVKSQIYIEGGESRQDTIRCRQAFSKLFRKMGLDRHMPRAFPCGARNTAFDAFKTAHATRKSGDFVALLVDSEDAVVDVERTWEHLEKRDGWAKPTDAFDEQVLLMTTCMETWLVADRATLKKHYGHLLQESALPALNNLEQRDRHEVYDKLVHATRKCSNSYAKGKRSFEVLEKLNPDALASLPSFERVKRILNEKLRSE